MADKFSRYVASDQYAGQMKAKMAKIMIEQQPPEKRVDSKNDFGSEEYASMTGQLNSARYSDNASSKHHSARRSRNPKSVASMP